MAQQVFSVDTDLSKIVVDTLVLKETELSDELLLDDFESIDCLDISLRIELQFGNRIDAQVLIAKLFPADHNPMRGLPTYGLLRETIRDLLRSQ